jgi:hypothetical protein
MALLEVTERKTLGGRRNGIKVEDRDGNPVKLPPGKILRGTTGETYRVAVPKPEDGVWTVLLDDTTGKPAKVARYLETED